MSKFDYDVSKAINIQDPPFYSLIMAAMRQADSSNAMVLRLAFPATWDELQQRYNAPGGIIEGDPEWQSQQDYQSGRWCGECQHGVVADPPCCFTEATP